MAVRKRKSRGTIPEVVKTHHLEMRYRRGELAVEVAEDPDNPRQQVTRLRRNCVYDELMNRGTITKEQRDCAERYAILCERSFGRSGNVYARIGSFLNEGRVNGHAWEPTAAQHDAFGKLFRIWQALGRHQRDLINCVVLGGMNCKQMAVQRNMNYQIVIGQVVSAFIRLEEVMG